MGTKELSPMFKECFCCKAKKPLFLFAKTKMKYQRPTDKGRMVCCRLCTVKEVVQKKGIVVRNAKLVHIEPTVINLIKEYFK